MRSIPNSSARIRTLVLLKKKRLSPLESCNRPLQPKSQIQTHSVINVPLRITKGTFMLNTVAAKWPLSTFVFEELEVRVPALWPPDPSTENRKPKKHRPNNFYFWTGANLTVYASPASHSFSLSLSLSLTRSEEKSEGECVCLSQSRSHHVFHLYGSTLLSTN